jgi:hypothetical protein
VTSRVSIIQVRGLLDAAEQSGAVGTEILAAAEFDPKRVAERGGWVDVEEFDRLIVAAVRVTEDAAFGLHWGEATSGARYDVLAPLIGGAETLRQAIAAMLRYQRLVTESDELELSPFENGLR